MTYGSEKIMQISWVLKKKIEKFSQSFMYNEILDDLLTDVAFSSGF